MVMKNIIQIVLLVIIVEGCNTSTNFSNQPDIKSDELKSLVARADSLSTTPRYPLLVSKNKGVSWENASHGLPD